MGSEQAALGLHKKADKKNKMYYVNRKKHRFPIPRVDENGKPVQKVNPVNGLPMFNVRGEPEYQEDYIQFNTWHGRFTPLGYWSVFEVKKETPKYIADYIEKLANSPKSEIMTEEAFIKATNPNMLDEIKEKNELVKENESLKDKLSKADQEIERLKQKVGAGK